MDEGRIIEDEEIKINISKKYPYQKWLDENLLTLKNIPYTSNVTPNENEDFETRMRMFGYTQEDISTIIIPMSKLAKEAIGSMGTDTPLAVLSSRPQLLFNYFKQLFAQVTNPPLDGIREEIITDTSLTIGNEFNLFETTSNHTKKLSIQNPIISNEDLDKIKFIENDHFKCLTIPTLYEINSGLNGLEDVLDEIVKTIEIGIDNDVNIVILSDRGVSKLLAPIPILLATAHVHNS